jgi:hypothetical protein
MNDLATFIEERGCKYGNERCREVAERFSTIEESVLQIKESALLFNEASHRIESSVNQIVADLNGNGSKGIKTRIALTEQNISRLWLTVTGVIGTGIGVISAGIGIIYTILKD